MFIRFFIHRITFNAVDTWLDIGPIRFFFGLDLTISTPMSLAQG